MSFWEEHDEQPAASILGADRYIDQRARLLTCDTDRVEALFLCLELQRWHRMSVRIICEEERRQFESGALVAKGWKRKRVTKMGDAFPRCHGTIPMLRADVLHGRLC